MRTIKTYQQAKDYLGNKKERPYAHNTRIEIDSLDLGHDVITVKYHGNPVVNLFPDGTITYNSCGWKTLTTKERINWFLPDGFTLYQEKSVWYISRHNHGVFVFTDGIAIRNGEVYNDGSMLETFQIKQAIKAIHKYVDGYIKALFNGDVPAPSGGDCWHCYFQTENGESLGDATKNTEHILSHMEESYYVPSLLVNADKFNHRLCQITKGVIHNMWNGKLEVSQWEASVTVRDIRSCLTAYLKHELGIAQ